MTDIRDQLAAAFRDAAHWCPGPDCPLTTAECNAEHPVAWTGMSRGIDYYEGTLNGLTDAALPAVQAAIDNAVHAALTPVRDLSTAWRRVGRNGCADELDQALTPKETRA